jgi:uncharacterized protein (DUF924 family)
VGDLGSEAVLEYWFGELSPGGAPSKATTGRWFRGGKPVDDEIRTRFGGDVARACSGELDHWADTPRGRLALVILLDQFTRNLHRGSAEAFRGDPHALRLACEAIDAGDDGRLLPVERYFLYMPLEHAESVEMQRRCVALFERLVEEAPADARGLFEGAADWARRHAAVIERFGRFCGRNDALGRESTAEEREFLRENPSGF